jgi:hypothetical protein
VVKVACQIVARRQKAGIQSECFSESLLRVGGVAEAIISDSEKVVPRGRARINLQSFFGFRLRGCKFAHADSLQSALKMAPRLLAGAQQRCEQQDNGITAFHDPPPRSRTLSNSLRVTCCRSLACIAW